MTHRTLISIALALGFQIGIAQDFKKTYLIPPGGQITIGNIQGDIKIEGYQGSAIEIIANKKGVEREQVEIHDRSAGDRIELYVMYPKFYFGRAGVDFEIKVPKTIGYNFTRVSTFDGNIEVSNVVGRLRVDSVRGNIQIRGVSGLVSASSHSGNVIAEIDRTRGHNNMRFSSISGNVSVSAPAGLDALVDMSSMSGQLKTDFPIEIQERRHGPGKSARGRLGSGKQVLFMSSISGNVSLNQKR